MSRGYWTNDVGKNMLKGVEGDVNNPILMVDKDILYAIEHSRVARAEFDRIVPSLLPDEQTRLTDLVKFNQYRSRLVIPIMVESDRQQTAAMSRIPVRTVGPRGGKGGHGA